MTYAVLTPVYEKTGESSMTPDGMVRWYRVAQMRHLGYAESMQDALRKFPRCKANGYSPILEWAGTLQ